MNPLVEFSVYFDGECPLCTREIRMLQRLDRARKIEFIDISRPGWQPETIGLSLTELMREIHGRLPDGTLVKGVEVFRRLYGAVGFSRLVAVSRWPIVRQGLDAAYRLFAKNRLRLTGRCVDDRCLVHTGSART
jgi:predicted DCC family thiol-disulfide oxidoreductase YuxK